MGGNTDKLGKQINGGVDIKGNGNNDGGKTDRSTTPPKSNTDGNGNTGTGTGNGNTGNGNTGTVERVISVPTDELSILTDEEKVKYQTASEQERKTILRNAKRRQRYAEQKQANGQEVKPRKVNKNTKKKDNVTFDVTQLNLIVAGVSTAIASRPNCEHWALQPAEIESITVPLAKMLAESETFAGMGQYSNQIALVMACFTVIVPRLFITVQKTKEVKKLERTGQHTDTNYRDGKSGTPRKTKDSNSQHNGGNVIRNEKSNGHNDVQSMPFYGDPLA